MKKQLWSGAAAVLLACFCMADIARAEEKAAKAEGPLCPVSRKPINFEVKTVNDDGAVYFCCEGCQKKFEAEPAQYSEKVQAQRTALASMPRVQSACPVSGRPAGKSAFTEQGGQKVYFCCNDCKAKYEAEPAKFKGKLEGSYTYFSAPACPVSGKPAVFSISVATKDGPVYFCCKGCPKAFEADPAKFEAKVAEQRKALAGRPRVQVSCPLSGKPINEKAFTEKDGEKVFFCCDNCKGEYEKDAAKYKAKLEGSYTYQTICPVSGHGIDAAVSVELADGQRVYLCCDGCKSKLTDDLAKYAPKLAAQGVPVDLEKAKAEKK